MFEDLEVDISKVQTKADNHSERHACDKCAGTGKSVIRSDTYAIQCFSCKGTGYFKTSKYQREKARVARINKKVRDAENNLETFAEEQPAAYEWLTTSTGNFAKSLLEGVQKYGGLTEKQLAAVHRIIARNAEQAAERERKAAQTKLDMGDLMHRFSLALQAGIKCPKINIADLQFSMAPMSGKNAGCVYVKSKMDSYGERTYYGKVTAEGKFYGSRDLTDDIRETIIEVGADVVKAAKAHGAQHGNCCFCNRPLNTDESVSNGYGPICADTYGLPWVVTDEFKQAKAALKQANEEAAS